MRQQAVNIREITEVKAQDERTLGMDLGIRNFVRGQIPKCLQSRFRNDLYVIHHNVSPQTFRLKKYWRPQTLIAATRHADNLAKGALVSHRSLIICITETVTATTGVGVVSSSSQFMCPRNVVGACS